MSDEDKEGDGGLSTAAYEWRYVDWDEGHTVLRHDKPDRNSFDVELELKDELVRRKDVKALIQDKIEKYDRPTTDPYVQQSIVDKLEQLLDEVQNSE